MADTDIHALPVAAVDDVSAELARVARFNAMQRPAPLTDADGFAVRDRYVTELRRLWRRSAVPGAVPDDLCLEVDDILWSDELSRVARFNAMNPTPPPAAGTEGDQWDTYVRDVQHLWHASAFNTVA